MKPEALTAYAEAMKIGEKNEITDELKKMLSTYDTILKAS